MKLTDPAFIRRLESLYLLARKVLGGQLQADRRTIRKGSGITFADYSEYSLGDDHRAIDWRVYGRLESLMIKLFEVEEDMTLYLVLDASRSMAGKFDYARKLAAALGYVALSNMDRLVVYGMSDKLEMLLAPCHGRGRILPFLQSLEQAPTRGVDTDFNSCAKMIPLRHKKRGMVVVVSDFFFPGGFDDGLSLLSWHGHEVFCLQVQDEADRRCDIKGDAELQCVESGDLQRVTVTAREAAMYEKAVADWNAGLAKACARRQIGLVSTTTEAPFDAVVQKILRQGGLVA